MYNLAPRRADSLKRIKVQKKRNWTVSLHRVRRYYKYRFRRAEFGSSYSIIHGTCCSSVVMLLVWRELLSSKAGIRLVRRNLFELRTISNQIYVCNFSLRNAYYLVGLFYAFSKYCYSRNRFPIWLEIVGNRTAEFVVNCDSVDLFAVLQYFKTANSAFPRHFM